MNPRGIAIVAKPPLPGRTKTRLSPPLTPEHVARLSSAFLRDVLLAAFGVRDASVLVVVPPGSDHAAIESLAPQPLEIIEDAGKDLGDSQQRAIDALLRRGCRTAVVIGADLPAISSDVLTAAHECLEHDECDVVLGPAYDGGYYLVASRRAVPELFEEIDWGTERVLAQTLERASAAGYRVRQLPTLSDVDTFDDLQRLVADLGLNGRLTASATRRALRELRSAGAPIPNGPTPWNLVGQRFELETPWRSLVVDRVRTHAGDELDWHYLSAPEPVVVVPVTADGNMVLIRQYRQPLRDWSLEVPAGTGSGSFDDVVRTELREEIGAIEIGYLEYVGSWYPMTGHASTLAHVYLAWGVKPGRPRLERNELLSTYSVPAQLAFDMARRGEITDGTCALAILVCEPKIRAWLQSRASDG